MTEVGDKVYWFAEHPGRNYAHGTRAGDTIKGRFYSVPKDTAMTQGQVTLTVRPNGSLERSSETGGFPAGRGDPRCAAHLIADELVKRLDDLVKATQEYGLFGYLLAMLVPNRVLIDKDSVVFSFQ